MSKNPLFKIAAVVLLVGCLMGGYLFWVSDDAGESCRTGCEKPGHAAPLVCQSSDDCETRGKDEWETCQHKQEPLTDTQRAMLSKDQTSKTQEGFSCLCVESLCKYHKP